MKTELERLVNKMAYPSKVETVHAYAKAPLYKCIMVRDDTQPQLSVAAKIESPCQAAEIVKALTDDSPVEKLVGIYLDAGSQVIGIEVLGVGGQQSCSVLASDVLRGAIIHAARALIVGHNHPSNVPVPSRGDESMTKALEKGADAVGLTLLDHVVVTPTNGYRSVMGHE